MFLREQIVTSYNYRPWSVVQIFKINQSEMKRKLDNETAAFCTLIITTLKITPLKTCGFKLKRVKSVRPSSIANKQSQCFFYVFFALPVR